MTDVSPELALIDPGLRAAAVADMPALEAFDFLRFERRPVALADFGFLAEHEDADLAPRRPPLFVAASVYAASSLVRVVVMDGLFVLALAAVVMALNVVG